MYHLILIIYAILDFCCDVNEICALLGFYCPNFKDQAVQDWPTVGTETSAGNWHSALRKIPKESRSYSVKFTELICYSCCTRRYLLVKYTSGIWAGSVTLLGVLLETTCDTYRRDVWVNNVAPLCLAVAWKTTKTPRTGVCMGTLIYLCMVVKNPMYEAIIVYSQLRVYSILFNRTICFGPG
jgi:hypothetical protein